MKIIDERKQEGISFQTIDVGQVFEYESHIYIKTDNRNSNVVTLSSGTLGCMLNGTKVVPLNTTLIIHPFTT